MAETHETVADITAEMREALEYMFILIDGRRLVLECETTEEISGVQGKLAEALAALSTPPRNCDVIGNTGRALVVHGFPTRSNQWGEGEWLEFIDWLFAPATKKEGEEK